MPRPLDPQNRDILEFRPDIGFIEPEVQPGENRAVEDGLQLEDIEASRDEVKRIATAVDVLSVAIQARVDERAKGLVIAVDPNIDIAVVQALERRFPSDSPSQITYEQYKNCKNCMKALGENTANDLLILPSHISGVKDDAIKARNNEGSLLAAQMGGFGTPESKDGRLRPELQPKSYIIKPINIVKFQATLICGLANYIWKNFIRKGIAKALRKKKITRPLVRLLPKKICKKKSKISKPKVKFKPGGTNPVFDLSAAFGLDMENGREDPEDTEVSDFEDITGDVNCFDCMIISKHFERGALYCTTEESVFALLTPLLSATGAQARGLSKQLDSNGSIVSVLSSQQKIQSAQVGAAGIIGQSDLNLKNLNKSSSSNENILTQIKGNFLPGQGIEADKPATVLNNIFNSKCIPCGQRINLAADFNIKKAVKAYLDYWKQWLIQQYQKLLEMLDMLLNPGGLGGVDLCIFIKFLKDFVCIPDLARLLSAFMALMMSLSFDLNLAFDFALALIAPLVMPFLSNLVDLLQKYLLLVIRPIQCIIDSLQRLIVKLDFNALFKNIDQLNKNISIGRRKGNPTPANLTIFGDILSPLGVDDEVHSGPHRDLLDTNVNLVDAATGGAIKRENAANRLAVEQARKELQALQNSAASLDLSNPTVRNDYSSKLEAAREKYKDTVDKRDLSAIGRANKKLTEFQNKFQSLIFSFINMVRKAVRKIEAFVKEVFDELKKLMGEYFGGSSTFLKLLADRLLLIQLISIIVQLIKLFKGDLHCNDDEKDFKAERFLPFMSRMKLWTDSDGSLHIEEDPDEVDRAINKTVEAFGPPSDDPRQKLRSLIEFTGDPVLDSSIARTIEALTKPVNIVFKCPLQTTVEDAEKVNEWIREVGAL